MHFAIIICNLWLGFLSKILYFFFIKEKYLLSMPIFLTTMCFHIIQKVSYASKQLINSQLSNTILKIDLDSLNMQTRIERVAETQLAPLWLVIKNCKNVLYSNDGFFFFFLFVNCKNKLSGPCP